VAFCFSVLPPLIFWFLSFAFSLSAVFGSSVSSSSVRASLFRFRFPLSAAFSSSVQASLFRVRFSLTAAFCFSVRSPLFSFAFSLSAAFCSSVRSSLSSAGEEAKFFLRAGQSDGRDFTRASRPHAHRWAGWANQAGSPGPRMRSRRDKAVPHPCLLPQEHQRQKTRRGCAPYAPVARHFVAALS
jgi:hypothetical protein